MAQPIRVVVTGAAGQIAYSLIYQLAKGDVFGPNQPVILHLLDIPPMMGVLEGVVMEIADCALPLVREVIPTADVAVAFKDVEAAFLVGAMPRREGMERKDLLSANVKIFKVQGEALDKYAKKSVLVLVVGNPANTNALICSKYAPSIPRENFSAMTRLDQNRAQAQLAARLKVPVDKVKNAIIWGNHSNTQFPDASHAVVDVNGKDVPVPQALNNDPWLTNDFVKTVQTRGAAVISARKMSSALSAAKAAGDHMKTLWQGTTPGQYASMAIISDGSYGVPADIMYSFPVTVKDKKWTIVQGLPINEFARSKMDLTAKELLEEREEALAVCSH
ncbi:malate dehydrogenase, cytoplasmic-like [Macrosteles quadrilineatus]|uniref:malate dehydrogenase, cytoplasmic-like n=1 Tax=Macrosteles quadrilineatus TaxID=74068 RepID=UPI0023E0C7E9|nr:malate dehydrogenase, cytoplasmic-like [Macrosteles quadrilineatus]